MPNESCRGAHLLAMAQAVGPDRRAGELSNMQFSAKTKSS